MFDQFDAQLTETSNALGQLTALIQQVITGRHSRHETIVGRRLRIDNTTLSTELLISFLYACVSYCKDQSNAVVVNLPSQSDTLYYDGECPICQREVALLRRRKDESLKLVDVHHDDSLTAQQREQLTNRLHVLCADGTWLTGYQANLQAWQHTDLNRWVPLLNVLPIRKLGEVGYELWLMLYRYLRKRRQQTQSTVRRP